MPRTGQIVPSYLVPHVQTYINDNSLISELSTEVADPAIRLLCVFTSAKGEDGKVKTIDNVADYIDEYGTPNFSLYGQPCYMPYAALNSGSAKVHCLRVMPSDAAFANVVISAYTKTVIDGNGVATYTVKFVADTIDNLLDKDTLSLQLDELAVLPPEVNDEGYNVYPLFIASAKGRGQYGNSFRIRIVNDTVTNTENDYQNYIFEILDVSSGSLSLKDSYRGSFDYNAIVNNASKLFDDIISDPELGSQYISIVTSSDNFTRIYNEYKSVVGDDSIIPDFNQCNLFTGLTKNGASMPGFTIDTDNSISVDTTVGISLNGGTEGSIALENENRLDVIDSLYIAAFNREIDPFVGSKRAIPCELILDANYSEEVKLKMAELALKRYDARCVIDAGIISTVSQATRWLNKASIKALDDFIISKEISHKQMRDPFTNRIITVTYTYDLAAQLPSHYLNVGNQVPFVGEAYSKLTDYIPYSIKPSIDADDLELKETLYEARCNFVECIAENTYVRNVQGTSQTSWTDLSEENNVAVLLEMKRMLEEFVSSRLYNFAEAEDRIKFTEAADRMFTDFRQSKVRSYEVSFDMNEFEEERSILHCYLSVVFKTMAKRGIIEIDINKRV